MTVVGALTEHDVVAVRAEVAAGRSVAVWFTAAAVGVSAGGSATVVAVGDIAEGDFIQVRRTGSRDTMFCSANELTRARPVRRRSAPGAAAATSTRPTPQRVSGTARTPASRPARKPSPTAGSRLAATNPAATNPAATNPAAPGSPPPEVEAPAAAPVRVGGTRRRAAAPAATAVRLTATPEGEWSVEVLAGTKQVVPATPVPVSDVVAAARSLPSAVAEAIGSVLEEARRLRRDRVEQLRGELEAAQRLLDQLDV